MLFLLKFILLDLFIIFITAHHNNKLCICYGRHIRLSIRPSVRLSVTLRYYVKTRERRRMHRLPPGSPVPPVFWCQEWLMGYDPVQIKVECKDIDPCENSRAVHISPHNSETVIDGENNSVRPNANGTCAFQRAINQGRASLLASLKRCSDAQICRFFAEMSTKNITSMPQSFILSKNF